MTKEDQIIGKTLNGIKIRKLLGEGGMGAVYEGYQERLRRKLAVKVMTGEHAKNPIAGEYFLREARSASQLRHPNIIQIYDFGEIDGLLYIAMEFVPGRPLGELMKEEFPLEPARIVDLLGQVLSALEEAHAHDIIHRDLKPENLMVEAGRQGERVKVLDFGIAKPTDEAGPLTRQGAVLGTPHYMSPEQATGDPVDGRSDLFSVGILLYQMLSGELPFLGKGLVQVIYKIVHDDPRLPSAVTDDVAVHPGLEAVCLRALRKDRDLRYQSASEFKEALEGALIGAVEKEAKPAPGMFVFKGRGGTKVGVREEAPESRPGIAPALDLGSIREDLLGSQALATLLVVHQRSGRRMDVEEQRALRAWVDRAMEEAAAAHGGVVLHRRGYCVALAFGVPQATGDEARRAVEAALRLRVALRREKPEETGFAFGLGRGKVYVSEDPLKVSGAPVDETAELARAAEDELVLVSGPELIAEISGEFDVSEGADGADEPAVVLGLRSLPGDRHRVDLVGRDDEVGHLLEALATVGSGQSRSVWIVGEAGMGKTALLDELSYLGRQRGFRSLRALHRLSGAAGVNDVLRQWVDRAWSDSVDLVAELGVRPESAEVLNRWRSGDLAELLGPGSAEVVADLESGAEQAVLAVVVEFMERMVATGGPLVLELDAVGDGDHEMARFLAVWVGLTEGRGVLTAAALRTVPAEVPEEVQVLPVSPLGEESARRLLRHLVAGQAPGWQVDNVVGVAGGSPAYLVQLARRLEEARGLEGAEFEEWLRGLDSLGGSLRTRVYGMPKEARNVLALLSVLGDGAPLQWLDDLASPSWRPAKAMQSLQDDGLLRVVEPGPRVEFTPGLVRQIAYGELPPAGRTRAHQRAAKYLEGRLAKAGERESSDLEPRLLEHLVRAGQKVRALEAAEKFGDEAIRRFEYELAGHFLRQAVALADEVEGVAAIRLARLRLKLCRIEVYAGRRDAAIDLARIVRGDSELPELLRQEATLDLAELWLDSEDTAQVESMVARAVESIRGESRKGSWLLIRALKVRAEALEKLGKIGAAADILLEALEMGAGLQDQVGDDGWRGRLLWEPVNQLGRLQLKLGEVDRAKRSLEEALRLARAFADPRGELAVKANLAALEQHRGNAAEAFRYLAEALAIARGLVDLGAEARLQYNLGLLYTKECRWEESRDAYQECLRLAELRGWREGVVLARDGLRQVRGEIDDE